MNLEGNKERIAAGIIEGRDAVEAREICQGLIPEQIGVPVYYKPINKTKKRLTVEKKPGEEDIAMIIRHEAEEYLRGIVLPTGQQNEFVYLGIYEQGFVFNSNSQSIHKNFHPRTSQSYILYGEDPLIGYLKRVHGDKLEVVLSEDEKPDEFNKIFILAVEKAREEMRRTKEERVKSRQALRESLFKSEETS